MMISPASPLQSTALPTPDRDREELDLLLRGFQVSRMLRLVADLGVADKIPTDGHLTVQELATTCAVLPEQLLRVLRALASFQIFQVSADGKVAHTHRARVCFGQTHRTVCTMQPASGLCAVHGVLGAGSMSR